MSRCTRGGRITDFTSVFSWAHFFFFSQGLQCQNLGMVLFQSWTWALTSNSEPRLKQSSLSFFYFCRAQQHKLWSWERQSGAFYTPILTEHAPSIVCQSYRDFLYYSVIIQLQCKTIWGQVHLFRNRIFFSPLSEMLEEAQTKSGPDIPVLWPNHNYVPITRGETKGVSSAFS